MLQKAYRMEEKMATLEQLRKELDRIDSELVRLFQDRMLVCGKVGKCKAASGHEVFDSQRERDKLRDVAAMVSGDFNKKCIKELYEQIMSMGRKLQYQLLCETEALDRTASMETASKVRICFELPDESGALYRVLSHFTYNDLNLIKLESKPIEGTRLEYRFFVDFEGNMRDAGVKRAIRGLKEEARNLKVLESD